MEGRFDVRLILAGLARHRMLHDHKERLFDIDDISDSEPVNERTRRIEPILRCELDLRRSEREHIAGILPHPYDPLSGLFARSEVEVRELGNRVPHALVDSAASVPSFDVRKRDIEIRRRNGGRKDLIAVATHDDDIGPQVVENGCELHDADAGGLGHGNAVAAFEHHGDARVDPESVTFDERFDSPIVRKKRRRADHDLKFDILSFSELFKHELPAAVVDAGCYDKTDFAFLLHRVIINNQSSITK